MGETMDETRLSVAYAIRRRMLGDAYVDAASAAADPILQEFQDYVTSVAWSVWTRNGLSTRDRAMLVLAMTAALGRMDEFRLHLTNTARTGVTDDEVNELVFQVTAYCGAPAGVSAMRVVREVRAGAG
jgi:4-carboxymuconolactone decarboxylase